MKYNEMATYIQEDSNGKMKIKYDDLIAYHQRNGNTNAVRSITRLKANGDKHDLIHLALTTAGIDYDEITDPALANTDFNTEFANVTMKLRDLDNFMGTNNYTTIKTDRASKRALKQYFKGNKTLQDLKNEGLFTTASTGT